MVLSAVDKGQVVPSCVPYPFAMPDEKDRIFYEVLLAARQEYGEAYLVTGNKKHFPDESAVISPIDMCKV